MSTERDWIRAADPGLIGQISGAVHAVGMQHIPQSNDAFDFMYIRSVYDWKDFNLIRPHALQCQVETLIRMDVGKHDWIDEIRKMLISALR